MGVPIATGVWRVWLVIQDGGHRHHTAELSLKVGPLLGRDGASICSAGMDRLIVMGFLLHQCYKSLLQRDLINW